MLRSWTWGHSGTAISCLTGINSLHKASPAFTTDEKGGFLVLEAGGRDVLFFFFLFSFFFFFDVTWGFYWKMPSKTQKWWKITSEWSRQSCAVTLKRRRTALWKEQSIQRGVHCYGNLLKEESQRQPVAVPISALWWRHFPWSEFEFEHFLSHEKFILMMEINVEHVTTDYFWSHLWDHFYYGLDVLS